MKSSYKRLGDFIQKVNVRNKNSQNTKLLGLSMTKEFRPHASNIIGTDLSVYKVVGHWQFACDFMSTIRVRKLPVVLQENDEQIIVSPAYTTFEVIDSTELDPEYLMMWFKREEFDRYAYFCCDSAVRGGFNWDELCDVKIPIPSIEKQREIVKEYNTIVNRIKLNEQLNKKLEETAQALYKHWFVDFEFPNENGQPYKSSGGAMVYNEELDAEAPCNFQLIEFKRIIDITSGKSVKKKSKHDSTFKYPIYGAGGVMGFTDNFLFDEKIISIGRVGTHGVVHRINSPCWPSDNTLVFRTKHYDYVYQLLLNLNYDQLNIGGVQGLITQTDIKNLKVLLPTEYILSSFQNFSEKIFNFLQNLKSENEHLDKLKMLLLSKISKVESLKNEKVL